MTSSGFNIAQEDSLDRVKTAFQRYRTISVDAEQADHRLASALKVAMELDLLSAEQIAEGTGIALDHVNDALVRAEDRIGRSDGFAERYAEAYPEKAAEAERKRAIRAARQEHFRQSVFEERRAAAEDV